MKNEKASADKKLIRLGIAVACGIVLIVLVNIIGSLMIDKGALDIRFTNTVSYVAVFAGAFCAAFVFSGNEKIILHSFVSGISILGILVAAGLIILSKMPIEPIKIVIIAVDIIIGSVLAAIIKGFIGGKR